MGLACDLVSAAAPCVLRCCGVGEPRSPAGWKLHPASLLPHVRAPPQLVTMGMQPSASR